jgi:hypothetical protein
MMVILCPLRALARVRAQHRRISDDSSRCYQR